MGEYFKKSTGIIPLAGALAGGINTVISCPQDVLKSQLQVQLVRQQYQGPISTLKALLQTHGPKCAYFGWRPLVFRDVLGYALLFYISLYNDLQFISNLYLRRTVRSCILFVYPSDRSRENGHDDIGLSGPHV